MSIPEKREPFSPAARRVPARKQRARHPLHLTILRFAVVLVLLTAVGIGLPTYLNTRTAVGRLSDTLVREIAQQTESKANDFLEQAHPALELSRELLEHDPQYGALQNRPPGEAEWRARARLFLPILKAYRQFDRVYLGDQSGDFTSAHRNRAGKLEVDHRWTEKGTPHRTLFQISETGAWTPVPVQAAPYDPRERPWYRAAKEAKDRGKPIWTPPYLFAASKQPGITSALPVLDAQHRVAGVCGIDYELHDLDLFVGQMRPGEAGKVYIFAGNAGEGGVVAQAGRALSGLETGSRSADLSLAAAAQSTDPIVKAAAGWLEKPQSHPGNGVRLSDMEFTVEGTRYLGATHPFHARDLNWTTVIAVPEEEILGTVRKNSIITLLWCVIAVLAASLFGYFYSLQVSRPLRAFAKEMKQVQNLEFSEEPSPPSSIDEVHEMGAALDTMKVGLRAFEKYVPTDLVRMLLQSGQDPVLGGESAPITVMFADIVGFSAISEQMSPQELVNALAAYLEEMEHIVWEHEGIVDKYIGDAVMALWGTPIRPRGEATRRACIAALECIERLKALQAERERQSRPFFTLNIGIHTGEALVGNIGSQRRYTYTAMGDTVNLTSRLESLNRIYGTKILLSESTYQVVQTDFEVRLIDHVAVKGRKTPLNIYELLARRGELDPSLHPLLAAYAEGLERYRARDWQGAREKFAEAVQVAPQPDPPSVLFMARCQEYFLSPPPEAWDGVYVYTKK